MRVAQQVEEQPKNSVTNKTRLRGTGRGRNERGRLRGGGSGTCQVPQRYRAPEHHKRNFEMQARCRRREGKAEGHLYGVRDHEVDSMHLMSGSVDDINYLSEVDERELWGQQYSPR